MLLIKRLFDSFLTPCVGGPFLVSPSIVPNPRRGKKMKREMKLSTTTLELRPFPTPWKSYTRRIYSVIRIPEFFGAFSNLSRNFSIHFCEIKFYYTCIIYTCPVYFVVFASALYTFAYYSNECVCVFLVFLMRIMFHRYVHSTHCTRV